MAQPADMNTLYDVLSRINPTSTEAVVIDHALSKSLRQLPPQIYTPPGMQLAVGMSVRIAPNSRFYTGGKDNPRDVTGMIVNIDPINPHIASHRFLNIDVEWPNGKNSYHKEDLIVMPPPILLEMTLG